MLFPSQTTKLSLYTFLVSELTPCFVLIYTNFKVGTADEREHETFVFLSLGYLSQYDLF